MDKRLRFTKNLIEPLRVAPGDAVNLRRDFDPGDTGHVTRQEADALLAQGVELLAEYQDRLAAQDTFGVLLVLQGIDASGKDGTIKHVMRGVNPQGVAVRSFKQPAAEELNHDFLWRYQCALPGRGRIGIFNRSHYEEVLVVRVHPDLLAAERLPTAARKRHVWARRYREINDWERYLVDNGIHIVKVLLNLSKREQAKRFLKRIDRPEKNWKFSASDVQERRFWDDYQRAFDKMLSRTSTPYAPWYVVPADHKWFTRLATAAVLAAALGDINPTYPAADPAAREQMAPVREELAGELGRQPGSHPPVQETHRPVDRLDRAVAPHVDDGRAQHRSPSGGW
jgi:PPK2 family polyphosphate:nucleotide phosphotransferase